MAASMEPGRLPSECFLHPESEDEESFVVLGSSLPPESLSVDCGSEAVESIETTVIQESLKLTASALSQLNSSAPSFPSIPKINEQDLMMPVQENNLITSTTTTTNLSVDLSPDEVQQKLDKLIAENLKLKETLHQNNLAMKKQCDMIMLWHDDVMKVQEAHREKFEQTKKYIDNLKIENAKLTEALKVAQKDVADEDEFFKTKKLPGSVDKVINDSFFTKSGQQLQLEIARHKILELESEIKTLQEEKFEKQPNAVVQNSLSEQVQNLEEELAHAKQLNIQQIADFARRVQESEALQKILLEEIKVLKAQLGEKVKNVITKETHENVQEQLMAAQMHITKLELLRNEDKDIINTKEEAITKMQNLVKEMSDSSDVMAALRAQLELYKSDFEAERQAKEALKAEKEQITDDLQHLQRRNQQLLEEVEHLRNGDFVHVNRPIAEQGTTASAPSAPEDSPPPRTFACPLCMIRFRSLRLVEDHIEYCLHNTQ